MSFYETLKSETTPERGSLYAAPIVRSALRGEVSREEYLAFLGQAYHHVKHTVPLLMSCGARLPDRLGWLRSAMVRYISEEFGHEAWILNDIEACGGDPQHVAAGRPNMETEVMVSYAYDIIARRNPVGFLGMVFVLEHTSIELAHTAMAAIKSSLQLPDKAFTYLDTHGTIDVAHVEFFAGLVNRLHRLEERDSLLHHAKVFYRLYTAVLVGLNPDYRMAA